MAKKQLIADDVPMQVPPDRPIQNSPYVEPTKFWSFNRITGEAKLDAGRRPAKYWYKTKQSAADMRAGQQALLELDEGQDDLPIVNALRDDVRRWRASGWENATPTTKELLRWWHRDPAGIGRGRRLFFCQLEAVETVIYLREVLASGRRPRFAPQFTPAMLDVLRDPPADPDARALTRLGCKMATGSGKTVVMAMLIAWAFCNRGRNPSDERFPSATLAVCPNLTVRERLQVLRPDVPDNYYDAFDLVPIGLRPLLQRGRVLVTNWHAFAPASPHAEGGKTYKVVDKGEETADVFARRVLGDLHDRLPVMVLNDEAHHCYRPKPEGELTVDERRDAKANAEDREEATRWVEGLDRINAAPAAKPGIAFCVDLSATPFYIGGSGHAEGSPFPWLVSDFGLVDAIESGIVKIPRLPVSDATGRPEARYFRLWRHVVDDLAPAQRLPGRAGKPKPDVAYEKAQPALIQLAHQWQERFVQSQAATPGQEKVPPVLIVVCDNTDIAEVFYRKISGESVADVVTLAEVEAELDDADEGDDVADAPATRKAKTPKPKVVYGKSEVLDAFTNRAKEPARTIRIDSKLLAEAEAGTGTRQEAAEALRRVVSTVGKIGEPGEHVRCVVSVSMLTEGWDANNVTHIFGLRAFGSQLLCEQVVGRGLRRMDYTPDPKTGFLTEEYVDVYGVPFTVIPFKGREAKQPAPEDKPKQHVYALPERAHLEIRFPIVEGYAFALRRNLIKCDVAAMPVLTLQPNDEPTATFVLPQVGIQEGRPSQHGPFPFETHDRAGYYRDTHLQAIQFRVARLVLERLTADNGSAADARRRVLRLQSRHQLFPQVLRFVSEFVARQVDFRGCKPAELGLEKYVQQIVERFAGDDGSILPNDDAGERPLMPILNRYAPIGTTADVDFKTTRPCHPVAKSHLNQAVLDTLTWESATAFKLDEGTYVNSFARNDDLGLLIAYEFDGVPHTYRPDWIVELISDVTLLLETKGQETPKDEAKRAAAQKWVEAVNNWGEMGRWAYHVNYDPHRLGEELKRIVQGGRIGSG